MTQQDTDAQKHIETYKSIISLSVELYKALLLLNGGGLIALLTYIGSQHGLAPTNTWLSSAIYIFIGGLSLVPISFALSYGVQIGIYNRFLNPNKRGKTDKSIDRKFYCAMTLTALSIVCFVVASIFAAHGLFSINTPPRLSSK
ncbi:hypothetical protein HHS34_007285 [Acidithiobacillus montserratensis]|uniref:Uncharacterized protein n=1 Tax=Acidithiobacillus montserratensis TaxID=2729135 RepID=A0ACD5HEG6_9PROT|nr:hypothetical protein [Acidithiobacillus montserratensis]MBU2748256.1 hypothetical protein [Acidithiobacillus montserratensis]